MDSTASGTGRVYDVNPIADGEELAVDHPAGATVLQLLDIPDLVNGEYLEIGGVVLPYTDVDDDAFTVTIPTGLPVAAAAGTRVTSWLGPGIEHGPAIEWIADMVDDEGDTDGDGADEAVVGHDLVDKLGEGIRQIKGEAVEWERDGSGIVITRILGRTPVTDPAYLEPTKLADLIGEYAPDGGSGQTFSPLEPTTTEGFSEEHAWWQIVDGSVAGFWRLASGAWIRQEIVTAEALVATNAIIDALSGISLDYVNIAGGSIYIAQGVQTSDPEAFAGTSLPAGWSSVKTGAAGIPGASVVATGPAGQVGSALLIDYGPSGATDAAGTGSGEVDTDVPDVANAQIRVRFRDLWGFASSPRDQAYLTIRSSDGAAFSNTWDALTLSLFAKTGLGGKRRHEVGVWINGLRTVLAVIDIATNTASDWHTAILRVQAGQVSAKIWRDGDLEPGFTTASQTSIASPGRVSLTWEQQAYTSATRGQKLWVDDFDVEAYGSGLEVDPSGGGDWKPVLDPIRDRITTLEAFGYDADTEALTFDSNGEATVAHVVGAVPRGFSFTQASNPANNLLFKLVAATETTFIVSCTNLATGNALASASRTVSWTAHR